MDRQTLRDWVIRYNAHGPDGLYDCWGEIQEPATFGTGKPNLERTPKALKRLRPNSSRPPGGTGVSCFGFMRYRYFLTCRHGDEPGQAHVHPATNAAD
jgi:hypothetical protein